MHVFQVLITDEPLAIDALPAPVQAAMQIVKDCFPGCEHQLWQRPELEQFIAHNFDAQVLTVFNSLRPYAYQADLARYCLLYVHGGWYVDLSLKMLVAVDVADHIDMIVFADRGCPSCEPWAIQNGLIYTKPGNPLFSRVIRRICGHAARRYYGASALCPTGPNCFGREFAADDTELRVVKGLFMPVTPTLSFQNLMYVAQTGQLIARHRTSWLPGSSGGDLSCLQLPGVNNYKQLWADRCVYGETDA